MEIYSISSSSAEVFSWCQFQYFLNYVLGFYTDTKAPSAMLGTIAHKVLEILAKMKKVGHYSKSKYWNAELLWNITYNSYQRKYPDVVEKIKSDKLKKVYLELNKLICSDFSPIYRNIIGTEHRFTLELDDPKFAIDRKDTGKIKYLRINGVIDRVDRINEDTIEIIDYKSGSRKDFNTSEYKDEGKLFKEMQPRLYHLAAKKLYPWAKNILVTFIYMCDGGPISVCFCDDDIECTKDMIYKRFKAIQNNEDPQRNKGWRCNVLCKFGGKNGDNLCNRVWEERNDFGLSYVKNKYQILNNKKC